MNKLQSLRQQWQTRAHAHAIKRSTDNFRYSLGDTWLADQAGGIRCGENIAISGNANTGKTLLALSLICQMVMTKPYPYIKRDGKKKPLVCLFLHETTHEMANRILYSIIFGLDKNSVLTQTRYEINRVVAAFFAERGYTLRIICFVDTRTLTGHDVVRLTERLAPEMAICYYEMPDLVPSLGKMLTFISDMVCKEKGVFISDHMTHRKNSDLLLLLGGGFKRTVTATLIVSLEIKKTDSIRQIDASVVKRSWHKLTDNHTLLELKIMDMLSRDNVVEENINHQV